MEMQLYPPGEPPFVDSTSCDTTHWCAALTIDSLECTEGFATCNANCEEPVNFAFIQTNGVPTGAPSPQEASTATFMPNSHTLLMNPGDTITIHMADAPAPGGGNAFKVTIDDLTLHKSGYMQASAANGFANTSIADCSGTPFNFEPEYSTRQAWATSSRGPRSRPTSAPSSRPATGSPARAFPTSSSSNPFDASDTDAGLQRLRTDPTRRHPTRAGGPEAGEANCYPRGRTHPGYDGPGTSTAPDQATGCQDNVYQNGDLDFDG